MGARSKTSTQADQASKRVGKSLRDRLFDDETVLMVVRPRRLARIPRYAATLGLYGFWRKRDELVLTDRRILLGKGIVRRDESSIKLDQVEVSSVGRRGINSFTELRIDDDGSHTYRRIGPTSARRARRFSTEILRRT